MGLSPRASSRRRSQPGEGPNFTPVITRAAYRWQPSGAEISTLASSSMGVGPSVTSIAGSVTVVLSLAARSLATPQWLRASPRFGVRSRSSIVSAIDCKYSLKSCPGSAWLVRIIMPE